jgi:DNA-binding CsgD family transcriptional regulator
MELPKNHITFTAAKDMSNLSVPLKLLLIDFFSYTRFYLDGTSISLLNNTDWYEFFLKKEVPGCVNVYKLKTGIHLWAELFPQAAVEDARQNFKIDNGIQFTFNQKEYVEVFSFASKPNTARALLTILSNIDLLEKYIHYFRGHAERLISQSIKQKIIIPEIMRGFKVVPSFSFKQTRKEFLKKIGYEDMMDDLTQREVQCLKHVANGMTAKKIARILGISYRTVEVHIANIKSKLNCNNKSQIAEMYWTLGDNENEIVSENQE